MSENNAAPTPEHNELGLSEEDLTAVSGGGVGDIGEDGTTIIITTIIVDPR